MILSFEYILFPITEITIKSVLIGFLDISMVFLSSFTMINWIFSAIILLLLGIIIYQFSLLRKAKGKTIFKKQFEDNDHPLASSNVLSIILELIPDLLYIKDKDSRFVVANKRIVNHMGFNIQDELIGKSDHDIYPKDMADEFRMDEIQIMASGEPKLNKIEKGRSNKGESIWVSTSKVPIKDKDGKVVGIIGIGKDITTQKLFEEELQKKTQEMQEANTILEERQEEILQQREELKVQSEEILKEKQSLRTLIDSMPDFIYFKDRTSRFIVVNEISAKGHNITTEEMVGKTDYDFLPKEDADKYYFDEQNIMSSGEALINMEETTTQSDGTKIFMSATKIPLKDTSGNVIGLVGISRNITHQKEIEQELRHNAEVMNETNVLLEEKQEEIQQQKEELQAQTEHLREVNFELEKLSIVASKTDNSIVILDKDMNFEWCNDSFTEFCGMEKDEFIKKYGKNLRDISSYEEIDKKIEEILQTKDSVTYIAKHNFKGDIDVWAQTMLTPVLDDKGEIYKFILIDTDITKIKEAEEQINKQKIEIEEQRDELTKLNATKDKFFSIIAHDLKNPFHTIMGFSDLLSKSYDEIDEEKKQEFIKLISDSSQGAYSLLENLLNWARTQTNRIKFEPTSFNLVPIIKQVYGVKKGDVINKDIALIPPKEEEIQVFADPNMIETVIRNLVSNSIKFTENKGKISVEVSINKDKAKVNVIDTGVGMSKEVQDKLFKLEEFHTSKGTSGESGTGLGLLICREFILKHDSDIEVSSEPGKGSSFSL